MAPVVESRAVKLLDLVSGLGAYTLSGHSAVDITSLSYDSRSTAPGALFFCVPGLKRDGHHFAVQAVARGAAALCVQHPLDLPVPQVIVNDVRVAMAMMARYFYEDPSRRLQVVGVTGTNGKTTTAYLTAWLLERAGNQTGLLGTVERIIGGRHLPTERTTPEALDLQQDLAAMVAAGDGTTV
ncbi:MAG: UDP-N-acetylmuramoyl-L-alanyl-D-glutamate--2,6-diaminopimelate ligase, partial [Actinobacteria bacterium]|nr:UDP-N-acetylmuramoyl-L-alanyl-D-glutamate--2,6-diaminopimelate ligase [Actinomycetota bacterium]